MRRALWRHRADVVFRFRLKVPLAGGEGVSDVLDDGAVAGYGDAALVPPDVMAPRVRPGAPPVRGREPAPAHGAVTRLLAPLLAVEP